jgi:hypothetical protein
MNAFKHLYTSVVSIRRKSSVDSWGKPTFGISTQHVAKWRLVSGSNRGEGILEVARHVLHLEPTPVGIDDEVTLPDGTVHPVIQVRMSSVPGGWQVMEIQL